MIEKPDDDDNNTKNDFIEYHKTFVETIKENLPNPTDIIIDQTIQMFIQWYNRRILILSSVIMISIPIYMIIIGVIFLNSCPKSFYLPLHMIICGTSSLIAAILLFIILIIWKKTMKLTSKITCYTNECIKIILSIFEIIFLLICLIGLIILTIILIKISNTVELMNQTFNYCHPIIYYSSYILLFLVYILLSIIMIIVFFIFHAYQKTQ